MNSVNAVLGSWASRAQAALVDFNRCFAPFFEGEGRLSEEIEAVLGQIQIRATCTSDSALFLISQGKLWDADILIRTVMEATVRFIFICAESDDRRRRVDEYLNVLPEIARIRRHARAKQLLDVVADKGEDMWRPIRDLLIPEHELQSLQTRFPKEMRTRLEGKWGFTQMIASLSRKTNEFEGAAALLHTYGISSHNVHLDGDALQMIWERENRSDDRIQAIELAHGATNIGAIMSFALIRVSEALKTRALHECDVTAAYLRHKTLREELEEAQKLFHAVEYGQA